MKWYQEKRLALWERLYALLNGDDFDHAVYCRYLDWTIRRAEAAKIARHRVMHIADSVHRAEKEHRSITQRIRRERQRLMN
jgi:hypothetical protein